MAQRKTTTRRSSTPRKRTTPRKTTRRPAARRQAPRQRRPKIALTLNLQQKGLIVGITLIFLTAVIVLSLLSPNQGRLTAFLAGWLWQLFGWGGVAATVALALGGFYLVLWGMDQAPSLPGFRLLGVALLFLAFEAFASMASVARNNGLADVWQVAEAQTGGGYLGGALVWLGTGAVGRLGAIFLYLVLGILGAIMTSGVTRHDAGTFLSDLFSRKEAAPAGREIPVIRGRESARPRTATGNGGQAPSRRPSTAEPAQRPAPEPVISRAGGEALKDKPARRAGRSRAPKAGEAGPEPVFVSAEARQSWSLPPLVEILEPGGEQEIGDALIREQVEIIEHTLESFGAPASVVEINQGPTITQYGVEPSFIESRTGRRTKVKVGKIASLADDLALALAARSIRIQAPVPGKGYVGIEVPNPEKALVSLRDVMESGAFQGIQSPLRIGLGQNVAGQPIATDLAQMPHLLIAGTTGSGKSVCVNSLVACLLLQNTPEELKLVMVDPKRVELTGYNGIPHLVAPVIVDLERVVGTLQWAMREMDQRYQRLADIAVRNIEEYNRRAAANGAEKMPHVVIFIDELADLMMLAPDETERSITRLAQMSRATGIHMVISTQRPSVDVVTGLIKANFPARIAFAVASSTDSRVILDTTGAERLLGQGDMLFQSPDAAAPVRMQGCFVSENELRRLIEYWRRAARSGRTGPRPERGGEAAEEVSVEQAAAEPAPTQEISQPPLWEELRQAEEEASKHSDDLLPEAIALVRDLNKASTSLLQRRFRIGYTRAARLMDIMEEEGIIGPPTGTSKAREVLAAEEPTDDGVSGRVEDQSDA
jgi:DNA segregation ATPase FtsK/SpoIIIE, S-DNA-T family